MYTKEDLKKQLQDMGLTGEETILIHSSMKSIGAVEGGADTVLDAWMEYFAEGLLLLPTHTWANVNADHPVYDYRSTPSCVGLLTNLFRLLPRCECTCCAHVLHPPVIFFRRSPSTGRTHLPVYRAYYFLPLPPHMLQHFFRILPCCAWDAENVPRRLCEIKPGVSGLWCSGRGDLR